ncbi:MAG: hypothetical protein HY657_02135 [Acidobacteria bacterium]|nr:hypothetical protein [Acidobacteriota bacterium]
MVLVLAGMVAFRGGADSAAEPPAVRRPEPAASAPSGGPPAQTAVPNAAVIARAEALAGLGPHQQASLPPIPFQAYAPPRPREVVVAAYQFAAEHPEILSYVPCFCGCERSGYVGNHDCFVRQRAQNGDVVAWDEHGVECAVCIDVATRARQMHASGGSVHDIRTVVDQEFARSPVRTPTPHPPGHGR